MIYRLSPDFIKIKETKGTVQNASIFTLEMSNKNEAGSGILIYPKQICSFANSTIYLRCIEGAAKARVVPFLANSGGTSSGGSSSATDDETFDDSDIDDIFNDKP